MIRFIQFSSFLIFAAGLWTMSAHRECLAQVAEEGVEDEAATPTEDPLQAPRQVGVTERANDEAIAQRLSEILQATEWFRSPNVEVREGIAFLSGTALSEERKTWAGQLAANTEDVVAVVNRMAVAPRPIWDLSPAWTGLRDLAREAVGALPFFIVGAILLLVAWVAARLTAKWAHVWLARRVRNRLLRNVAARALAIVVFVFGLYLVLRVAGLTRLALTVVGGTGVVGIVIGIAFRDIAENFLASILISMQNPFRTGDLIEVDGHKGFVQRVTTRGTLLMALDGTYVQIPNAIIYKSTILNWTANPNSKQDFTVGIGYADSIAEAQQVAMRVLRAHPAVLDDPEPLVLAEKLSAATVTLRVHFWINSDRLSLLKVRSSVIRLVKLALQEAGISMPDEAREVVFPQAVPVRMLDGRPAEADGVRSVEPVPPPHVPHREGETSVTTDAEGDLVTEADEIHKQARESRKPEEGVDLLGGA